MNKFELWRQRRREQRAGEAAVPDEMPDADAEALSADATPKGTHPEHGADQEDTVPAAFYRNIG